MDVLITIAQMLAVAAMILGIILIDDTGLQIFFIAGFVLAALVAVEARRST